MGKGSDPPPPPDYAGAAQATAAGDLETARFANRANRANIYTPWGSQTWAELGGDRWAMDVQVDPAIAGALRSQQTVQGELSGLGERMLPQAERAMSSEFDMSGVPDAPSAEWGADEGVRQAILERLRPDMDRRREAEQARLAAQGITEGSEAWNRSMEQMDRAETDMESQALLAGAQEYDKVYGRQDQARSRALQEQAWLRTLPISEINAVLRGQQVNMPQFPGYSQMQTTRGPNYLAAAQGQYGAEMDAYNAQQAQRANMMSGLFGLGRAAVTGFLA